MPETTGKKMIKAIYAGSFDPVTYGHLDIIQRSKKFCGQLTIGIGINPAKKTLFSEEERVKQINRMLDAHMDFLTGVDIKVETFQGLLVEYAKQIGATVLIRGIRSISDFENEMNLANINRLLAPEIETVLLPTKPELEIVSSSMVKEVAKYGADVSKFTTKWVQEDLKSKFGFIKHGE